MTPGRADQSIRAAAATSARRGVGSSNSRSGSTGAPLTIDLQDVAGILAHNVGEAVEAGWISVEHGERLVGRTWLEWLAAVGR
jgi:hypothetical protein